MLIMGYEISALDDRGFIYYKEIRKIFGSEYQSAQRRVKFHDSYLI